jgi:hypothetical protein
MPALGEVEGTPHLAHPARRQHCWWMAIPETCPPGEGMAFEIDKIEIDKIFWETKQTA